ncbi:MAG: hypothetical protein CSA20_02585, partial [Deltaproteobacteria bacterium]
SLTEPYRLVLPYTRYMALSLLFFPAPQHILLVGLGAGSLVRFFHHLFPQCIIDAVDHSQEIIDLAKDYFFLPRTASLNIYCEDGFKFLGNAPKKEIYDLILLDAFDEMGMAETIYNNAFFAACTKRLKPWGLFCANLWSGEETELARINQELADVFCLHLSCPVPNRGNVISYAFQQIIDWQKVQCHPLLTEQNNSGGVNFTEMLSHLRQQHLS